MNDPVQNLPDGYQMRATVPEDAEAIAHIHTVSSRLQGEHKIITVDDVRSAWQHPDLILAQSSRVVVDRDGQVTGFVMVRRDLQPNPVHPFISWSVLPVPERHAIALVLFAWGDERARHVIERCPPEARIAWRTGSTANYAPNQAIMTALNLTPVYYYNRMRITMQSAPEFRPLPAGLTLRTYQHPDEMRRVVLAIDDAWRDHFGYIERTPDEIVASWQETIDNDALFDPSLWLLAVDEASGEIAGVVTARIEEPNEPASSYVEAVATRRPWRGQGIAQSLLLQAFGELWRRGKPSIILYVDGNSLTGANRLYERVGMYIDQQYVQYEREIRPGIELANT
jgi:mycothiol synthase